MCANCILHHHPCIVWWMHPPSCRHAQVAMQPVLDCWVHAHVHTAVHTPRCVYLECQVQLSCAITLGHARLQLQSHSPPHAQNHITPTTPPINQQSAVITGFAHASCAYIFALFTVYNTVESTPWSRSVTWHMPVRRFVLRYTSVQKCACNVSSLRTMCVGSSEVSCRKSNGCNVFSSSFVLGIKGLSGSGEQVPIDGCGV